MRDGRRELGVAEDKTYVHQRNWADRDQHTYQASLAEAQVPASSPR